MPNNLKIKAIVANIAGYFLKYKEHKITSLAGRNGLYVVALHPVSATTIQIKLLGSMSRWSLLNLLQLSDAELDFLLRHVCKPDFNLEAFQLQLELTES